MSKSKNVILMAIGIAASRNENIFHDHYNDLFERCNGRYAVVPPKGMKRKKKKRGKK